MKIAKVVANPYCAIDADGIPQGVVPLPGTRGVWIGALLDHIASEETGTTRFYFPRAKDGSQRVVEVPVTDAGMRGYIASCVNDGSLLAADEETARCFGIHKSESKDSDEGYQPVEKILEMEKAKALARLVRLHADETRTLKDFPTEPSKRSTDVAPQPQSPNAIKLDGVISAIKPKTEGK